VFLVLLRNEIIKARKIALFKVFEPLLNACQSGKEIIVFEAKPQGKYGQSRVLNILPGGGGALMKQRFDVGR